MSSSQLSFCNSLRRWLLGVLSALFPFLLYPKQQRLGSSQWCGDDRVLRTGWEAKDLESCIIERSCPPGKAGQEFS